MFNHNILEKKMAVNRTGNPNPNWPSKTGARSGSGRGNNPSKK